MIESECSMMGREGISSSTVLVVESCIRNFRGQYTGKEIECSLNVFFRGTGVVGKGSTAGLITDLMTRED